ncbi:MAG: PDZ domain-containing protein [Deltaproteobacteria bacterium]|nr:PDZ domain-containing protein [Deltaproteobacteria bacterium]
MKSSISESKLPPRSGRRTRFVATALLVVALLATACRQDPAAQLVGDMYGLIEEFYISATAPADLTASAMQGLERSLAAKAYREKLEKEKAEKPAEAKTETSAPSPSPDAAPSSEPEPTPASPHRTNGDPSVGAPDEPTPEGSLDPYALPEDENGELPPGPLRVEIEGHHAVLSIANESLAIDIPEDRRGAVDAFLRAYVFVRDNLDGGDPKQDLFNDALGYMTFRLDPHSQFMAASQYTRLRDETSGHFGGVGIEVGMRSEQLTVIAPIPGTPAAKAGLKPMDRIVKVDGVETLGLSLTEAVDMIRGEIGTSVTLTMRRADEPPFEVSLLRSDIPVNTIKAERIEGDIAWIRVYSFNQNTGADLRKALGEFDRKAPPLRGIILDMRNNPGGLLDQAVEVADEFLSAGIIVNTIGRGRLRETEKFATMPGARGNVPVIALINSVSASGTEIVAGALQDHKRALILGTRSFGKGSVQSIFKLREDAGLRLTTALYYTPSGRSIQAQGIVPDVLVKLSPEEERMLAMYWSESALSGHLKSQAVTESEADVVCEAEKMRAHYLKTGAIVEDENYPEKGDWLLVFAREILDGEDRSIPAMTERARAIVNDL